MINFANSLDPNQAGQNDGLDMDSNCLLMMVFMEDILKKVLFEKISRRQKHAKLPSMLRVKDIYFVTYGIISDFTDKGQFQYLTNLKGPQEGTYLYTRVIFYVRRIGLYLYKYRIYGTISIFERSSFCLSTDTNFTSLALISVKIYSFE